MVRSRKIWDFVEGCVNVYNHQDYDDLSSTDKEEFAALFIEAAPSYDRFCFLTDSDNAEQTLNTFIDTLLKGTPETDKTFLETLKTNAVNYYAETMSRVYEEIKSELDSEREAYRNFAARYGDPDQSYDEARDRC